jgi:protein-disulfide isomerase
MKRYLPFIIIIIVLAGAVGVGILLATWSAHKSDSTFATTNQSTPPGGNSPPSTQAPVQSAPLARPNVKVSSPVVVEEYGDYQCPPCGQLYPELKQIEAEYGDQLRIVFHHFPLTKLHKNAMAAAHAAEAARNQTKFWEMHDRLYRNQKEWSELDDPRPVFISYARELKLNIPQFTADMESNLVDQRINADMQRAASMGISGTPTILIEGQMLRYDATNPEGLRRGINLMLERKAQS